MAQKISKTILDLDTLTGKTKKVVQLDPTYDAPWSAGQLSYDAFHGSTVVDTGISGVRVNVGQENMIRFYNDTASPITNGTVVNGGGVDATTQAIKAVPANAALPQTSSVILGVSTSTVAPGEVGLATKLGDVHDMDTTGLVVGGIAYLDETGNGTLTNVKPLYPANVVIMGTVLEVGTEGTVFVDVTPFNRRSGSKSYSFTSNGIGSGIYYVGGFYEAPLVDMTLSNGTSTQVYGTANIAYGAHAFIVSDGLATVDTGTVGIRVDGDSITENGQISAGDFEVLTSDMESLTASEYIETTKKWVGIITYSLVPAGGAGIFSGNFNYGLAKYEDLGNTDVTITDFECVGLSSANPTDTTFNIELLHHKPSNWLYSAGAFVPGDGAICSWKDDMAPYDNIINNEYFAYKRVDVDTYVAGQGVEGVIVRITTGQNNSVQSMDLHIGARSEELF